MSSNTSSQSTAPSTWSPRLFVGDEFTIDPTDPDLVTLREAYTTHVLPVLIEEEVESIGEFETLLKDWEERTDNPLIRFIDDDVVKAFLKQFKPPDYAPHTRAKKWRYLRRILRVLAPESANPDGGKNIILRMPRYKVGKLPRRSNRIASLDELDDVYRACSVATWPHVSGVTPPQYWRAAVVSFYNLGPRAWDLFCESAKKPDREWIGWRWESVNWRAKTLRFTTDKTDDEVLLPLNTIVLAHLQSIRGDRWSIFPATRNRGRLYREWEAIKRKAGIAIGGPEDLDFQDLRHTCQTEWDAVIMGLGDYICVHAPEGVGATWYRNFSRKAMDNCERIPQPKAFQQIFNAPQSRQMRLFD